MSMAWTLEDTRVLMMEEFNKSAVELLVVEADVRHEYEVERMVLEVVLRFGRLDYAINAAGVKGDFLPSAASTSKCLTRSTQ